MAKRLMVLIAGIDDLSPPDVLDTKRVSIHRGTAGDVCETR